MLMESIYSRCQIVDLPCRSKQWQIRVFGHPEIIHNGALSHGMNDRRIVHDWLLQFQDQGVHVAEYLKVSFIYFVSELG